jgi:hypothetical protein
MKLHGCSVERVHDCELDHHLKVVKMVLNSLILVCSLQQYFGGVGIKLRVQEISEQI